MTKNWPDRIKVATFAVILVPFITLVFFLIQAFTGVFTIISMYEGIIISIAIAVVLDICFVTMKWKKLKNNEILGNVPDMSDQNNISLPRTIIAIVVIVLVVLAYINYKLYSVTMAKILLLACIIISVIEIIYLKSKKRNLN